MRVCLLPNASKKLWAIFHEIWGTCRLWTREELIKSFGNDLEHIPDTSRSWVPPHVERSHCGRICLYWYTRKHPLLDGNDTVSTSLWRGGGHRVPSSIKCRDAYDVKVTHASNRSRCWTRTWNRVPDTADTTTSAAASCPTSPQSRASLSYLSVCV